MPWPSLGYWPVPWQGFCDSSLLNVCDWMWTFTCSSDCQHWLNPFSSIRTLPNVLGTSRCSSRDSVALWSKGLGSPNTGRDQVTNPSWERYWRTSMAEQKRPGEGEKAIGTFEEFSERIKRKWCMVAVPGACISQVICQLTESQEGRVLPSSFHSPAQPYSFSLWLPNWLPVNM